MSKSGKDKRMPAIYENLKLESLRVGARIAFLRKLNGITQEELGNAIGLIGSDARNKIWRYEHTERVPKDDKILKLADALGIEIAAIRHYDFSDPLDIYYLLLWTEEISPNYVINKVESIRPENNTQRLLGDKYTEWHRMRLRYKKGDISLQEYRKWKFGKRGESR